MRHIIRLVWKIAHQWLILSRLHNSEYSTVLQTCFLKLGFVPTRKNILVSYPFSRDVLFLLDRYTTGQVVMLDGNCRFEWIGMEKQHKIRRSPLFVITVSLPKGTGQISQYL